MTTASVPLPAALVEALRQQFGTRYSQGESVRLQHGRDESKHEPMLPDGVVFAESTEEVAAVVRLCREYRVPVIPYGVGSSVEGHVLAVHGGISIDLSGMNRVLSIHAEDLDVTVQAGVTRKQLNDELKGTGLFFPIDPGADATLGGMAATRASGTNAVRYGTMRENVLSLTVVTPEGKVVRTGSRARKSSAGYDLTRLFVGSEGTLGIVTKVYLKLMPSPQYVADLLVPFADMQTAIDIVPKIMTNGGIIPTCLEFMDSTSIKAAEQYLNQKLPYSDAGAYIIVEVDGSSESQVEDDYITIGRLCQENGALEVFVADNISAQERIWKARKCFAEALRLVSPVYCMEDIVVPVSNIPKALAEFERISGKCGVRIPCCGHAGDGNIHATLLKEDMDEETWHDKKEKALDEIYTVTYALGGNLSGEHGIGAKRKDALAKFMDPIQLDVIRAIKKALDPNSILNPGKIVDVA